MIYQDTKANRTPFQPHIALSHDEASVVKELMKLRAAGPNNNIARAIAGWMQKHASDEAHFVTRDEPARQIRETIAQAALGSVINAEGVAVPVSNDIRKYMRVVDSGDDALAMGQAPTDVTEFEQHVHEVVARPLYPDPETIQPFRPAA